MTDIIPMQYFFSEVSKSGTKIVEYDPKKYDLTKLVENEPCYIKNVHYVFQDIP